MKRLLATASAMALIAALLGMPTSAQSIQRSFSTVAGLLNIWTPGMAVTSAEKGVTVSNQTASTGGVTVQMSGRVTQRGTAWDTAASKTVEFFTEVLPATAATPTGTWKLGYSLNGAAPTYPATISSVGTLTLLTNLVAGSRTYPGGAANLALASPANGVMNLLNNAETIGAQLKADALPTVASGFGTSPAITAGSTPLAGSVNVGTGGVATSGVVNFNGTAFPSAPFVICMNTTTATILKCAATTTQLTITGAAAFVASDIVAWHAISSK